VNDLSCEYAIVGTGAAGPVLAYHLARAGKEVVLIERGPDVPPEAMSDDEPDMVARLYKDGGAQLNTGCDLFLLQGNCVGGSTVLTNGVCFRFPDETLALWEREFGLRFDRARLDAAQDRIESVLNVHDLEPELLNPSTPLLERGIRALGLEPRFFRKNFLDCVGCGGCNIGCRYGRKLHSGITWVPMARERGATLLAETEVESIEGGPGGVRALRCRDLPSGRGFRVRAERYVLSAGAINSPGLLLKSGIRGEGTVGRWVSFHLAAVCTGEFEEPIDAFDGDQMGLWVDERPDFFLEQIHNPPALFALSLPLRYGEHHAQMARYRHMTGLGVLVATEPTGEVFHSRLPLFREETRFAASPGELARMRVGIELAARIFRAAGAREVFRPPEAFGLCSSHPQGGCRMGVSANSSAVDPGFRVWGFDNLFVCDASLFPTALGVNPQVSIMALADLAATAIAGLEPPRSIEDGPAAAARRRLGLAPDSPILLPPG